MNVNSVIKLGAFPGQPFCLHHLIVLTFLEFCLEFANLLVLAQQQLVRLWPGQFSVIDFESRPSKETMYLLYFVGEPGPSSNANKKYYKDMQRIQQIQTTNTTHSDKEDRQAWH